MEQSRQVAQTYRSALHRVAPAACAAIDQAAVWAGQAWVAPQAAVEVENDLVTVRRAAELVGMSRRWVYEWARTNDMIKAKSPIRVRLCDVRAAVADKRARRAQSSRSE